MSSATFSDFLVPVVCRACGGVHRVQWSSFDPAGSVSCASCGARIDLASIAATLPRALLPSTPARPTRVFSEFA